MGRHFDCSLVRFVFVLLSDQKYEKSQRDTLLNPWFCSFTQAAKLRQFALYVQAEGRYVRTFFKAVVGLKVQRGVESGMFWVY